LPGDETTPPDGGTTPPDSGTNPPDEDDKPPSSPCGGISYATPFPRLSGYIVEPVGEEVIVIAGDTLNLRANGSPDPDLDQTISRAPDPESGECSSSEKIIRGLPLSFIWRLWEDTDRDGKPDRLIGNIGDRKQISWRVPEKAGIYFVELVVDDDGNPDKDNPPEEVKCAKCTAYSTADDPAVRDWVKVRVCAMDLDVDSDNNNDLALLDRSRWEEEVEDVVGDDHCPGKVLLVNDVDYDEDDIVDWADGFDLDPLIPDDDVSTNSQFVPVILEVSNIDFANAKIRIHYDASDPSLIDINAVDPSTMLPHLPSGKLRLWRKNGNEPRSKLPLSQGGDFIAPGVYSPAQLGLSPSQPMTVLFVEAVRASDQVADLAILVEIDPTGMKGFILRDQVRLTAVRIEIIGRDLTDGYERLDYGFAISQPDGSDEWQEEVYRVRVYDPRNSIQPKLLISGHTLPLSRVGTYFETPPFLVIPPSESTPVPQNSGDKLLLTLDEGLGTMEYVFGDSDITVLASNVPEFLNKLWRRIRKMFFSRQHRDVQMQKAIKAVVNELRSKEWRPTDLGHFGREVHEKVKNFLKEYGDSNWLFDVYVGPDGKILSIGGRPSGLIPKGSTQIDALYLKPRCRLQVGELFEPNKK
jgi:hypothetical protein